MTTPKSNPGDCKFCFYDALLSLSIVGVYAAGILVVHMVGKAITFSWVTVLSTKSNVVRSIDFQSILFSLIPLIHFFSLYDAIIIRNLYKYHVITLL